MKGPTPKKRLSKTRSRRRHSMYVHKKQVKLAQRTTLVKCRNCGEPKRAHHVCPHCGMYRGKLVIDKAAKAVKQIKKIKA